jgi:hypothetical protein
MPAGMAIFSQRQHEALVSETAVPFSQSMRRGRFYAEIGGGVNTAVAIANPNAQPAAISFYLTDTAGRDFGYGSTTVSAGAQIARFLTEPPFNSVPFTGSMTFTASIPVSAIAFKTFVNERSEFLFTALPVLDLLVPTDQAVIIPGFLDGGGWTTQIVLLNPAEETISGSIQFRGQANDVSDFPYTIPPHASLRFRSSGMGTSARSGFVRIITSAVRPLGFALISLANSNVTIFETQIPATQTSTALRLYVEQSPGLETGVAIANPSDRTVAATLSLLTLSGEPVEGNTTLSIPANGQTTVFLDQIPELSMPPGTLFRGVLRVTSSSIEGVSVAGLRAHHNERGELLVSSIPFISESAVPVYSQMVLPHLVAGGGYSTELIFLSVHQGQSSAGTVRSFSQSGMPIDAGMHGSF